MLVTALEASPEVPKIDVVTKSLIHEETKQKDANHQQDKRAMTSKQNNRKEPKCHFCGKQGHFKRDCFNYIKSLKGKEFKSDWKFKKGLAQQKTCTAEEQSEDKVINSNDKRSSLSANRD